MILLNKIIISKTTSNSLCRNVYSIFYGCTRREGGRERDIIIFIYTTLLQASKLLFFASIHLKCEPPSKLPNFESFSNPSFSTVDINTVTVETLCVYMNVCLCAAMYILMRCSRPFIHQPFTPSAIRPIFLSQPKALNGRGNIFKKLEYCSVCVYGRMVVGNNTIGKMSKL